MTENSDNVSLLMQQRVRLAERLKAIKNDLKAGLDRDSEEQASQLENYEVLLEIERVTSERLSELDRQIGFWQQQKKLLNLSWAVREPSTTSFLSLNRLINTL